MAVPPVPPVPQGVSVCVRYGGSTSSTGCLCLCEIWRFHQFHKVSLSVWDRRFHQFHRFHQLHMVSVSGYVRYGGSTSSKGCPWLGEILRCHQFLKIHRVSLDVWDIEVTPVPPVPQDVSGCLRYGGSTSPPVSPSPPVSQGVSCCSRYWGSTVSYYYIGCLWHFKIWKFHQFTIPPVPQVVSDCLRTSKCCAWCSNRRNWSCAF